MKDKRYYVTWDINIYAKNPKEAAKLAFKYMQAPTTATVFTVKELGTKKKAVVVDLMKEPA
jgi:hypothetical protein